MSQGEENDLRGSIHVAEWMRVLEVLRVSGITGLDVLFKVRVDGAGIVAHLNHKHIISKMMIIQTIL